MIKLSQEEKAKLSEKAIYVYLIIAFGISVFNLIG